MIDAKQIELIGKGRLKQERNAKDYTYTNTTNGRVAPEGNGSDLKRDDNIRIASTNTVSNSDCGCFIILCLHLYHFFSLSPSLLYTS